MHEMWKSEKLVGDGSNVLPTMLKMRQRETGEGCQEKGYHGG